MSDVLRLEHLHVILTKEREQTTSLITALLRDRDHALREASRLDRLLLEERESHSLTRSQLSATKSSFDALSLGENSTFACQAVLADAAKRIHVFEQRAKDSDARLDAMVALLDERTARLTVLNRRLKELQRESERESERDRAPRHRSLRRRSTGREGRSTGREGKSTGREGKSTGREGKSAIERFGPPPAIPSEERTVDRIPVHVSAPAPPLPPLEAEAEAAALKVIAKQRSKVVRPNSVRRESKEKSPKACHACFERENELLQLRVLLKRRDDEIVRLATLEQQVEQLAAERADVAREQALRKQLAVAEQRIAALEALHADTAKRAASPTSSESLPRPRLSMSVPSTATNSLDFDAFDDFDTNGVGSQTLTRIQDMMEEIRSQSATPIGE